MAASRIAAHELLRRGAPETLLDGVGERERVQRRVPVAELVRDREARDPGRRGERDRRGELDLRGAVPQRGEERLEDRRRLAREDDLDQLVPAAPSGTRRSLRFGQARSNAPSSSATRSTGLRQAFASSIRSAKASCAGSDASTGSARSQPATSSASNALLTKSSVWPPSR